MANHRMYAKHIISSDRFLNLSPRAQILYIHIGLNADDDGFTDRIQSIRRSTDATSDDLKQLVDAGYVYVFQSGIAVDLYWNVNNSIRRDRYKPTIYQEEKLLLTVETDSSYSINTISQPSENPMATTCQPTDNQKTIVRQPISNPATNEYQPDNDQMYTQDKQDNLKSFVYQENIQTLATETDNSLSINVISQPNDNPFATTCQPNNNQMSAQDKLDDKVSKVHPSIQETNSSLKNVVDTNCNITRANARVIEENHKPNDFIPKGTSLHQEDLITEAKSSMVGWMDDDKKNLTNENVIEPLFQKFMKEYPRPVKMQEPAKGVFRELVQKYGVDPYDLIEAAACYTKKVLEEKTMERFMTVPQNFLADLMWVKYISPTWKRCPICHGTGYYDDGRGMTICKCTKRYSKIPKLDNHML